VTEILSRPYIVIKVNLEAEDFDLIYFSKLNCSCLETSLILIVLGLILTNGSQLFCGQWEAQ